MDLLFWEVEYATTIPVSTVLGRAFRIGLLHGRCLWMWRFFLWLSTASVRRFFNCENDDMNQFFKVCALGGGTSTVWVSRVFSFKSTVGVG